ncbi:hypothetical protein ScPMuIL_004134 [Solemya velum]
MEEQEKQESSHKEKKRKRTKAVYHQIQDQMEFYFSDANLQRDRFLKKQIDESKDGYIELSVFLNFNKIRSITTEIDDIRKGLSKSDELQLSEDGAKVKRIKPLEMPHNVDERTVYVECLPHDADHDWLKKTFSSFGKIAYVSLPRYRTSGDTKGFAFIEFETESSAEKACKEMNNPPVDVLGKPGMFPKTSKQLLALQKNVNDAPDKEIKTEVESKDGEEKLKHKKHKKRRRNTSESSVDGCAELLLSKRRKTFSGEFKTEDIPITASELSGLKRQRTESECSKEGISDSPKKKKTDSKNSRESEQRNDSTEGDPSTEKGKGDDEDLLSPKRKKKRKRSRNKSELSSSLENEADNSKKSDVDRHRDSRKRKLDEDQHKSETQSNSNIDDTGTKKIDDLPVRESRKRKSHGEDCTSESAIPAKMSKESRASEDGSGLKDSSKSSAKKKNRNRKRKHSEKETPELRVISKKEWLGLRAEYLTLQKASMAELKKKLHSAQEAKSEEPPKKNGFVEFTPGVIVKFKSENPITRRELKAGVVDETKIAYVDLLDGNNDGHIRCNDAEAAKQIVASTFASCDFTLLEGEEEKLYWEKLKADREAKLSQPRQRPKKRGFVKLIEKAQKANAAQLQKKHIVFDD